MPKAVNARIPRMPPLKRTIKRRTIISKGIDAATKPKN
jgi:hypothetical protein